MAENDRAFFVWDEKADWTGKRDGERKDNRLNYGPLGMFSGEKKRKVADLDDGSEIWEVE